MEGLKQRDMLWLIMMVGMMLTCAVCRDPQLHKVGGSKGWTQNVNYTFWANHDRFYIRDWLDFVFDKRYYNALEVNKTNYEQCNDQNFIRNITQGGRDVFELKEARPYYFLSGGGYCFQGMKVAINVEEFVPSPSPSPASSTASPTITGSGIMVHIMITIASAWGLFLILYF